MYISDPDFEAMKDITRLSWLIDMRPASAAKQREPALAATLSRTDVA